MDQKRIVNPAESEATTREPNTTYELFIGILGVYSLLVVGLIFLLPVSSPAREILLVADTLTCFIFLADFFRSLIRAPRKRAYLKWGWLDLLGSIPGILILRLARLRRLGQAVGVLRQQKRGKVFRRLSQRLAESAIGGTGLVVILALTFGSLFILQAERQDPAANIRTSADALWWSFVTMSTVGYGDYFPVTRWGRLLAILLMTVGVGIFGVLTSYLATVFITPYQKDKESTDDIKSLRDDMAALQAKLEVIERLLKDSKT
jgi:voltage-gated potassium channel